MTGAARLAWAAAAPPVGGEEGRRLARQELSRPEYRPGDGSVLQRVLDALDRFLSGLTGGGGTDLVLGIVGVVIVVLVVVLAVRAGRVPGRRRREDAGRDPLATTPGVDHAAEADRLRAAGEHAAAVREYLRAAVADLERRGVLVPRPGRTGAAAAVQAETAGLKAAATAAAAADEGGRAVPAADDALHAGAAVFDETWFGTRTATADDVEVARRAFDAVRAAGVAAAR